MLTPHSEYLLYGIFNPEDVGRKFLQIPGTSLSRGSHNLHNLDIRFTRLSARADATQHGNDSSEKFLTNFATIIRVLGTSAS